MHGARSILDFLVEDELPVEDLDIEGGVLDDVFHNPPSTPLVTLSPDNIAGGDESEDVSEESAPESEEDIPVEAGEVEDVLGPIESQACNLVDRLLETFAHLSIDSENEKTGHMPVSTTSAVTCPPSCVFKSKWNPKTKRMSGACYAQGFLGWHWAHVTAGERGTPWDQFCERIATEVAPGQLWRHNQAGDLPGEGEEIDADELHELVEANRGKRGFTYSHKYNTPENLELIKWSNENGFTINLSANNPAHADELAALGVGPVATVVPSEQRTNLTTPGGRKIVICPYVTRGLTCEACALCQKQRSVIVGLPAHGSGTAKANAIARGTGAQARVDKIVDLIHQKAF